MPDDDAPKPPEPRLRHICECCGKTEVLTSDEAYRQGWDYPPKMGVYGVVSQRTCGSCPMEKSLWWRMMTGELGSPQDLTDADRELLERIAGEPESILVADDD